jgi:hypothetical protein
MIKVLLIAVILPCIVYANTDTAFTWTDCGSPALDMEQLLIDPQPIVQPGKGEFTGKFKLSRLPEGSLRTKIDITRSVGTINLPIKW